jgi:hypothetical protein
VCSSLTGRFNMLTFPFFRRKLAHRLRVCALGRRRACVGNPSGEDLKVMDLCGRLALDAERLPAAIVDEVAALCADQAFARRFEQVWQALPDVLGVVLAPPNAVSLVRWMIDQARHDFGLEPQRPDPALDPRGLSPLRRSTTVPQARGVLQAFAVGRDFAAAFAIVAPLLVAWELSTAVGQQRDRVFAASHAPISATVEAVTTNISRSTLAPATATLAFAPPGQRDLCHVAVQLGDRTLVAVGRPLTVVPRSRVCEAPLVPQAIGNPFATLTVALLLLAGGVGSLKVWMRSGRGRAAIRNRVTVRSAAFGAAS